jgi:hypothetical protein
MHSITSNSYFSNLRCCKFMIKKLKIEAGDYDDEDMGETNRALNLDLDN